MARSAVQTEWMTLRREGRIRLEREGFMIEAQLNDQHLYLLTTLFSGDNYLPGSVRQCLKGRALQALDSHLAVSLTLDEENFRVLLLVQTDVSTAQAFEGILQDFFQLAHEWRHELDARGQDDLMHIPVSD